MSILLDLEPYQVLYILVLGAWIVASFHIGAEE